MGWRVLLTIVLALGVVSGLSAIISAQTPAYLPTARAPSLQPVAQDAAQVCLEADSFDLAALRTFLADPNPPAGVQQINRYITAEFMGKDTLAAPGPGDTLPQQLSMSTERCFTCGSADYFPNRVRRVTPDIVDRFNVLRETHP